MVNIFDQTATVGAVPSKIIVSVVSDVVFHAASLNLIYTVLVASPADNVRAILELHDCRLVGLAVLPKATSTHADVSSVAHVVFNVTDVDCVYEAPAFIEKLPPVGAVLSTVKKLEMVAMLSLPAARILILYCVESHPAVAVFQE